jgi:predicted nucleotidyltransferase
MFDPLIEELSRLEAVEAIALGGSRAGDHYDEKSDYDVYLYCTGPVDEAIRRQILSRYCSVVEIGNRFWEYEDNCTLKNGIDIDILYRDLDGFVADVASVVEQHQARNGYTTCMWHNLLTCKIICDKTGRLTAAKERFSVPYPDQLRSNIIEQNRRLLHTAMPAYRLQIEKAANRGDIVSISHRTAAFMESYFDILFALNRKTHPGEKRLISLCLENCPSLPADFEENLHRLFSQLYGDPTVIAANLERIIEELEKIL